MEQPKKNEMGPIGTAALGLGTGIVDTAANVIFGNMIQKRQLKGQKEALKNQNEAQLDMWNKTNYGAQMQHLKDAGLNPGLLYGMSGGGGVTAGSASAMPSTTGQAGGMDIAGAAQIALLNAQRKNIEADTANKIQSAATGRTQEQNNILEGVIKKYAGDEAAVQWIMNESMRTQEYGAKSDEYEARQVQATNVIRMWENGQMQKMSETELNNKLAELGFKNAQIKGKNLENAILELEKTMQEKLGIDRSSPTWMKVAGRLFLGLIGGK